MSNNEALAAWFASPTPPPTKLGHLRILSAHSALRSSPLHLGAMSIGTAWSAMLGSMDKDAAFALLDAYFAAGGNFIDTASGYQNEQSEQWIGEWMAARGNRDQVLVATKFTMDYKVHVYGKGGGANQSGNGRRSIRLSVRDSLAKLQTDYIDVLYLHFWDFTASIREVMDTLHALVEAGTVLYLGVSDTPAWVVAAANTYALENGKTPFSVYQGRWNVKVRDVERDIIPVVRHFGMAMCVWDAMGGGLWQSAKQLAERKARNENLRATANGLELAPDDAAMSQALEAVAAELGEDVSVQAVALAWVRERAAQLKVNVFPIVGGRKTEHLKSNIGALDIKLTDAQMEKLQAVKPFVAEFPYTLTGPDPNVESTASSRVNTTATMEWDLPFRP